MLLDTTRHAVAIAADADIPFNYRDARELELRSAWAYSTSFKCPMRLYYGREEKHFTLSTQPRKISDRTWTQRTGNRG